MFNSLLQPHVREHLIASGQLQPVPDIPDWQAGPWRAWHRLNHDRPWRAAGMAGMMPGPIPWRDVVEWCAFHNLSGDEVAVYDAIIRALDGAFLSWHAERMQKQDKN